MSSMAAYGDFGLGEAEAIRKRKYRSSRNTESLRLAQTRGARNLEAIQRKYAEGFQPMVGGFGRRGFGGPNVNSGIRTRGLERYAADLQRELGAESTNMQELINGVQLDEMDAQNELENYLAAARLAKQNDIFNAALEIKGLT